MPRLREFLDGVAILDDAERVVAKFPSFTTGDTGQLAVPADVQTAAPTGTTSTSLVLAGCGILITPGRSGIVKVTFSGTCSTGTNTDGGKHQIAYKLTPSSTLPANGATATGTLIGSIQNMLATTAASAKYPFSLTASVGGLTVGKTYWFDLQFAAVTGGTYTLANVNASAHEIGN